MVDGFLWINKSSASTSLSSSSNQETRDIFQFVQKKRRAPQRAAKEAAKRKQSGGHSRQTTRPRLLPVSSHDSMQSDGNGTSQDRSSHGTHEPTGVMDLSIKTLNLRSGACVDPFDSTVVPITKPMEAIFKYYWKMVLVGGPNSKEEVLPPHVRTPQSFDAVREQAMREALTDKLALAGLLASMASRMVHFSQLTLPGGLSPEYYIESTIQILRTRLLDAQDRGDCADLSAYFAIWRLALASCIAGDLDSVKVHLQACKELLESSNGDDPMQRYVRVGIAAIDLIRACETLELVLPPVQRPDYSTIIANAREQVDLAASSRGIHISEEFNPLSSLMPCTDILNDAYLTIDFSLGSGFHEALTLGIFPLPFPHIITDLLSALTLAKLVWRTPHATQQDAQAMCALAKDVLRALCAFVPDPFSLRGKRLQALQLSLIIVLARAVTRYGHRSTAPNMRRLKTALCGVDVEWNLDCESDDLLAQGGYDWNKLLLWVLMTGHDAAYGSEGGEEEMWWRVRAAYVAGKVGVGSYMELHGHMRRYLYSWSKQKMSLEAVGLHLGGEVVVDAGEGGGGGGGGML